MGAWEVFSAKLAKQTENLNFYCQWCQLCSVTWLFNFPVLVSISNEYQRMLFLVLLVNSSEVVLWYFIRCFISTTTTSKLFFVLYRQSACVTAADPQLHWACCPYWRLQEFLWSLQHCARDALRYKRQFSFCVCICKNKLPPRHLQAALSPGISQTIPPAELPNFYGYYKQESYVSSKDNEKNRKKSYDSFCLCSLTRNLLSKESSGRSAVLKGCLKTE